MLNTVLTTDKIQAVTTDATTTVAYQSSSVDCDNSTPTAQVFTELNKQGLITGAATTDLTAVPAASHFVNTKFINLRNTHATLPQTVTVQFNANGTLYELFKCILLIGEELTLRDGVWFHYDVNGGVYGQALPVASDTVVGGIQIATQAVMETATSLVTAVAPGRMKYHPGCAKSTLHTTGTATPVADASCTYNCTLTDTGVGQLTVNFTVAFSAAGSYAVLVSHEIISTTLTAVANVLISFMRFGGQASASSCQVNACDHTATTMVIRDPISWAVVTFGDQA